MKYDLKNLNRRQLERLRAEVDKALDRVAAAEKKEAIRAAQKAAKAHGFSLAELTAEIAASPSSATKPRKAKPASDGRAKVAPKYANPANPDEKWTGRGRAPKWMQAHLEAGGSKDDCLI